MNEIKNIEAEQIENNAEPESEETSTTGDRDCLGRKKRRWGYSRESRAKLRNIAEAADSQITNEHRLRLLWTENFEALDQNAQDALRQRERHVLYLSGCMLFFLAQFVHSRVEPSNKSNPTVGMPVAVKSPVMASVPGFIEALSINVQRAVLLNQAIQSDIREGIKKFKDDLQEKL